VSVCSGVALGPHFFVHIAKIQVLKFMFVYKIEIKKILISEKILT